MICWKKLFKTKGDNSIPLLVYFWHKDNVEKSILWRINSILIVVCTWNAAFIKINILIKRRCLVTPLISPYPSDCIMTCVIDFLKNKNELLLSCSWKERNGFDTFILDWTQFVSIRKVSSRVYSRDSDTCMNVGKWIVCGL